LEIFLLETDRKSLLNVLWKNAENLMKQEENFTAVGQQPIAVQNMCD